MSAELFDVLAVDIATRRVRVMARSMDEKNAEAYIQLSVVRRGVDVEYFDAVPAGTKQEGDIR